MVYRLFTLLIVRSLSVLASVSNISDKSNSTPPVTPLYALLLDAPSPVDQMFADPIQARCSLLPIGVLFQLDRMCLDAWRPALVDHDIRWPAESCHFLERFYHSGRYQPSSPPPPPVIPSPPAPALSHQAGDGVMELVPIPCKPCDQDRKDRNFIRGAAFSNSMTKLLVDYASAQSGGKILAHSDGLRGVSDVLATDENRYLLTLCSNKVWFTIRLSEEIFVEKLAFVSSELFASTFRHIQVLGSRQYPTNEWRVLGEIETNPMETHEWFDLSASGQCSKCYVKFLKIRVLTHHALEGYTNCALTRIQVVGNTVLQSLDRIQSMNSSMSQVGTAQTPAFVKLGNRGASFVDQRIRFITGEPPVISPPPVEEPVAEVPTTPSPMDDGNSPLLKFVEEMTQLKRQYSSVVSSVYSMNEIIKSQAGIIGVLQSSNVTSVAAAAPASASVMLSVFGISFLVPKLKFEWSSVLVAVLIVIQVVGVAATLRKPGQPQPSSNPSYLVVNDTGITGRRFSVRESVPFKKRSHGLWKPKPKRFLAMRESVVDARTPARVKSEDRDENEVKR